MDDNKLKELKEWTEVYKKYFYLIRKQYHILLKNIQKKFIGIF